MVASTFGASEKMLESEGIGVISMLGAPVPALGSNGVDSRDARAATLLGLSRSWSSASAGTAAAADSVVLLDETESLLELTADMVSVSTPIAPPAQTRSQSPILIDTDTLFSVIAPYRYHI